MQNKLGILAIYMVAAIITIILLADRLTNIEQEPVLGHIALDILFLSIGLFISLIKVFCILTEKKE